MSILGSGLELLGADEESEQVLVDEPKRELLGVELGAVKSVTVGAAAAEVGVVDTGTLNPFVSLVLLVFVLGLVGDELSMKIIMPEFSNKHNRFKAKYGSDEWTRTTDPRLMSPVL